MAGHQIGTGSAVLGFPTHQANPAASSPPQSQRSHQGSSSQSRTSRQRGHQRPTGSIRCTGTRLRSWRRVGRSCQRREWRRRHLPAVAPSLGPLGSFAVGPRHDGNRKFITAQLISRQPAPTLKDDDVASRVTFDYGQGLRGEFPVSHSFLVIDSPLA